LRRARFDSVTKPAECLGHFSDALLLGRFADLWASFLVPDSPVQYLPDQATEFVGNYSNGLIMCQTRHSARRPCCVIPNAVTPRSRWSDQRAPSTPGRLILSRKLLRSPQKLVPGLTLTAHTAHSELSHILFLPSIERLLRNSYSAEQLRQRHPRLGLLQNSHDLFNSEALLFHGKTLPFQV